MRERIVRIAGVIVVLGIGFAAGRWNQQASARAISQASRIVRTVTLHNFVCSQHGPRVAFYETYHCVISSFSLSHRPLAMDFEFYSAPTNAWFSASLPASIEENPTLRNLVHLAWVNGRVVLYGPITVGEGPTSAVRLPDATIQYEAVTG